MPSSTCRGAHKFGSAKGYGLAYGVTRMEEHDRLWRRMAKIAQRLGDEPDPELPPRKPKGMRTATYDRLLETGTGPPNGGTRSTMPSSPVSPPG